jgi:hypothetical protein
LILALLWALSHALAALACIAALRLWAPFFLGLPDPLGAALLGAFGGAVAGSAQELVLRARGQGGKGRGSRGWALATVAGAAAGVACFSLLSRAHYRITGLFALGVAVGLAQWFVLRRRSPLALFWPPASAGAFVLGGLLSIATRLPLVPAALAFGAGGLLSGAILGFLLARKRCDVGDQPPEV